MKNLYSSTDIAIVLAVAFILRAAFAILTPLGTEYDGVIPGFNDEKSHYSYIKYLAERKALPVQTLSVKDDGAFVKNEFEYYQPPLYYLLSVPLYAAGHVLGERDYILLRMLPVLLGVISLYLAYMVMRLLFGDNDWRALIGTLFLAVLGSHVRFSSLLSNDSLLWVIAGAYILMLLRINRNQRSLGSEALVPVLIGAGLLTKSSFLLLLPALFVPYIMQGGFSWRGVRRPFVIFAAGLVIALPWYYRNIVVYGNILPLDIGHGAPEGLGFNILKAAVFIIYQNSFSLWFPYVVWPYPAIVKLTAAGYTVLTALLSVLFLVAIVKRRHVYFRSPMFLVSCAFLVPFIAGYVRYSFVYGQIDARLMLPVQPFLAVALVWCLQRLTGNGARRTMCVGMALCLVPYVIAFAWY